MTKEQRERVNAIANGLHRDLSDKDRGAIRAALADVDELAEAAEKCLDYYGTQWQDEKFTKLRQAVKECKND